jgi:branched-chain amino acid transport system substrate-binding protein
MLCEAVAAAIGATKMPTAAGNLEFDPATHVALQSNDFIPFSFWQIQNGNRVLIEPAAYANGDFLLPPWVSKKEEGPKRWLIQFL